MHLALDATKYRKENHIIRPDMVNMLMEARGMLKSDNFKSHNREWDNAFYFSFLTAASLLCLTAHEVIENPDVQEKLLQEIQDVDRYLDGKPLTYDVILNMHYMDMVVFETLRKWRVAPPMDQVCTDDTTYELKTGQKLEIGKSDAIWIPALGEISKHGLLVQLANLRLSQRDREAVMRCLRIHLQQRQILQSLPAQQQQHTQVGGKRFPALTHEELHRHANMIMQNALMKRRIEEQNNLGLKKLLNAAAVQQQHI
uniref:Cytochrome P450 n=1 Tax=Glossina palpalis gambiensis TaxID=67801 RepID=A0A1B0C6F5_9MUSC